MLATNNPIPNLLKTLLLLSLISFCYSGLVFPGKKVQILPDDTVVEVTDLNVRRLSASLPMGRRLIIKFKGSIESGKGWYIRDFTKKQRELLVPQNLNSFNSGEYVNNQDECGRMTTEGFYYFIFKPRKVGKAELNFSYRKPFQWDTPKNTSFQVTVRIMRNVFDDVGLQEDSDSKTIYKDYQRKQKFNRVPKEAKKHVFKVYGHNYKKFNCGCNDDFDF